MPGDQHHYLHRVYLEGFQVPSGPHKGKVWALRNNEKVFPVVPRSIAKRERYYTLNRTEEPRTLEDFFSKVEGNAVPYLRRCLTDPFVPVDVERFWVHAYVAVHLLRVPSVRDALQSTVSNVMNAMLAVTASIPGALEGILIEEGASTPETASTDAARIKDGIGHYRAELADNEDAALLISSLDVPLAALSHMKMQVAVAEKGCHFITGDRPVLTSFPGPQLGGFGLAHPEVEVTFPLNSRTLLLFTWDGEDEVSEVPANVVEHVNLRTAAYCSELLIGPEKQQLERFKTLRQQAKERAGRARSGLGS